MKKLRAFVVSLMLAITLSGLICPTMPVRANGDDPPQDKKDGGPVKKEEVDWEDLIKTIIIIIISR